VSFSCQLHEQPRQMSMSHAEDFSADLAQAANLHFRLAELLEQHGTQAVLTALATACQGVAEGPAEGDALWLDGAQKLRAAGSSISAAEKRSGVTLEDACRVLADIVEPK
jgi:hypothetical protein